MKKLCMFALLLLAMLGALGARTESASAAEASEGIREAVALAETALQLPLDGVPVLGADAPMPEDMWLCGPYLFLASTDGDQDEIYIPDQSALNYASAGLPSGAEIRVDKTLVSASDVPEGARAVFPLLLSTGYCGGASYISLGSVYYQAFSALLIDRETGEVAARVDGPRREGTSKMLSRGDYRKDMNDRYVFWFGSTPKHLKDMWIDVFDTATVNGYALFLTDGMATSLLGNVGGTLVIPDGVTEIGKEAFMECADIKAVHFPGSLISVGERAFEGCTGLNTLEVPEGVTLLSYSAFQDCTGLERVTLPESLTKIRYLCFSGCSNLKEINLPSGLGEIGLECFSGCTDLEHIVIPERIKEIPQACFARCTALASVEFTGKHTRLGARAFNDCVSLKQIIVPQYAFTIDEYCFSGCNALESVEITGTLVEVGNGAFEGCSALTTLSFGNTGTIGAGVFRDCDRLTDITFGVTRLHAARKWDKAWNDGCIAKIHWKRDPLLPVLMALVVAIAITVITVMRKRKRRRTQAE